MLEVILRLTDVAERERKAANDRQELLIAELNHRVRNILTLIRGLVGHSKSGAGSLEEFAKVLNDRIYALSRAHDQITREHWGPAPLADLFEAEVGAYLGQKANRIEMSGPSVLLAPQAFATMALVAHELVTNSAKYGALKDSHGKVTLTWKVDDMGRLVVEWIERGGPPVQAPMRRGFGSTVIERSVPYDLQGEAEITYALAGVEARFVVPAAFVQVKDAEVTAVESPKAVAASKQKKQPLSGRALLVEDNLIIALDAEDMLIRLGASGVDVASSVRDAISVIDSNAPDFALLDVNLVGETSFPIAERLKQAGVPFLFATGYGDNLALPQEFKGTTIVSKPYEDADIAAAFQKKKR